MAEARQSLIRWQPLVLGIGFALLVAISAGTVWLVDRAASDAARLAETLLVQNKLSNLLLNVRRAESSQRGYLFTNDPTYLETFKGAEPEARELVTQLQATIGARPQRQAAVARIAQLVDAKFAELTTTIALNQAGPHEEARSAVQSDRGREIMNALRELVEQAVDEEARIAAARTEVSQDTNTTLMAVTLVGAAMIALIGLISIVSVQRNLRKRETAQAELAGINANLERIVAYRTADLTEANEEIQRFAYIVSHDLRSPLVNIMGFTSELEALRQDIFQQIEKLKADLAALNAPAAEGDAAPIEQLGQDFDEAIRFIKSSIGNMDRLINAVLKLSREGRRRFAPETVDVAALMEAIVQTVAHRASELGATVTLGSLPPVESDRLALEQVFANLIDNALKYGRTEDPLKIDISGRISGAQAIYEVTDNGRGIDPRDHQRVFELFRRSGTQDRPGEGIGLAHVRALVRRLGGTMGLSSELGRGSTFTVTLPQRWLAEKRIAA